MVESLRVRSYISDFCGFLIIEITAKHICIQYLESQKKVMNKKVIYGGFALATAALLLLNTSAAIPKKAKAIEHFILEKYLGKWYEVARIDFKFEKNLNNTTAEYSLNENGSVKVLNQGYNYVDKKWTSSEGKAKFRGEESVAELKVSFFGPFYSGYNVIAIDKDYQFALVAGKNLDYLWILSREPKIPLHIKEEYLKIAKQVGYDVNRLIWVEHSSAK